MKNLLRLVMNARPYWWLLAITGISLLAITALNLTAPWLIMQLTDLLTGNIQTNAMIRIRNLALILVAVYVVKAFFSYFYRYLSHVAAWHLVADMRVRVYNHLQKLSMKYYHDKQTGQLMSRAANDTATFEVLIAHAVPDLITNVLILASVTVILFLIHPTLAILTVIPVPILVYSGFYFMKKVLPYFRKAQSSLADLNAVLQDNISGMKEIQVFNQQNREEKRVKVRADKYTSAILHGLRLSAVFHPSVEMLTSFGTVIVVGFGGYLAINGVLNVSDIVGFILYLNLFYQPIGMLARVTEDLQQAIAGADRVYEILDTDPDIKDTRNAEDIGTVSGKIRFDHVSFHYVEHSPVLKDICFTAQPGQMIALVGPTGVGKTTIISLITRFYDPVSGNVFIDGHNLKDITLSSLRNQISIVLQDVFLFHGNVAENIAYGTKKATMDEIVHAAKIAMAHDFISKLPEGYNTIIGERGVKLSGGQKQRLSIARAVLRNTPILILDEATASVDVETESDIQKAIQSLTGNRTIIVIAHRLSTIKKADQILVLKDGQIVEQGTHDELLQQSGLYYDLNKVQFHSVE